MSQLTQAVGRSRRKSKQPTPPDAFVFRIQTADPLPPNAEQSEIAKLKDALETASQGFAVIIFNSPADSAAHIVALDYKKAIEVALA